MNQLPLITYQLIMNVSCGILNGLSKCQSMIYSIYNDLLVAY